MPDHLNRSPCRLHESAPEAAGLREAFDAAPDTFTFYEEEREGKKVKMVRVNIATVDVINRNGRYYSRAVYEKANERAKEDLTAGKLWGLLEHPDWTDGNKGRLERIAVKYEELGIDGDTVYGKAVIVETDAGRTFRALKDAGVQVGVSTNGFGSQKYVPAKELNADFSDPERLIAVIQDDFRYFTIDLVGDPSNLGGSVPTEGAASTAPAQREETNMHKILKDLCAKHGCTLEQLKTQHATEYLRALEQIAQEATATATATTTAPATPATAAVTAPATEAGTVSLDAYRALEQTVVELRGTVTTLQTENLNTRRDAIVASALEAARLPSAGTVKHGDTEIDLDASFRTELIQAARAAESDEAARTSVENKITQRKALLGVKPTQDAKPGVNGVRLPTGNVEGKTATTATARPAHEQLSSLGL